MKYSLDFRHRLGLEIARKSNIANTREHKLTQLFWECTLRCNLKCRHCGSDCKNVAGVKDMPREDFLAVLDSLAPNVDPHKVFVIITGGEPLMRPDLEECGRAIYERGFPWGMVTNGYAMTPNRFNALLDAGLHTMTVSIDGFEDEHDWLRGVKGSFSRAVNAIRMAAESGIVFDAVTCVTNKNLTLLPEIKQYLYSIGLRDWRLFTVFPTGRAATDPTLSLNHEGFVSLMEFIKASRREKLMRVSYGCEGFLGNYEGDVRDNFFQCHAGINVASVLIDGSISSCPSIRADYNQGNIYNDDFYDVWTNRFQVYRDRSWMKTGDCADCQFFRYCNGNGMHLRESDGTLKFCHLKRLATP